MAGIILASEAFLYWLLHGFRHKLFWPITIGITGLVAFLLEQNLAAAAAGAGIGGILSAIFSRWIKGRNGLALMLMAPAFLMISLVIIYPFFFEIRLAFADLNMYSIAHWLQSGELSWTGLENFYNVFTQSPLQTASFWRLLFRTFLWTVINVAFHVVIGLALAMLLNRPVKFKGLYRTLLIVPWAMPQVVAVLAWRGEFHPEFGFVNQFLSMAGLPTFNWWSQPWPVFVSCCVVNIWLGIPFMMIVFLGGLQSIPRSCYEAADIDGASKWDQFKGITLPLLKPVVVPSVTLGTIWTFNNINVIYLMTGQDGGNEFADILVSALYKSAFTYSRYSYSAAFALVIFVILMMITAIWIKLSQGTESNP